MKLYLVEFLVRLGVAVIADGAIKPRWYGSDQAKVCKRVQRGWWMERGKTPVTPGWYYCTRMYVSGGNWQAKQYHKVAVATRRDLA